ncbi:unnamed protein product [Lactuca saligna]|uniref:TIR domain-containing protein n=1 Tax=Lactuca saligna TaxID=75948 RepID=A0AA35VT18_LACSI|nr:unnamed protein product [Lactuca saligna]
MTSNQIVIPIFYDVEPTHVRKQIGSFNDAMAKHIQKMAAETDANKRREMAQRIEGWIQALTEVAGLKGMDLDGRSETEFIKKIVKDIYRRLQGQRRSLSKRLLRTSTVDYNYP